MDYNRNVDKLGCLTSYREPRGVQYSIVEDLEGEPVSLEFFKAHARIDFDCEDYLIQFYLTAAREYLEKWCQLSFGVKTIRLTALELPENYRLMYGRVDEVTTADYTNIGDILKEGGTDINIEFTTLNWIDNNIRIAICRYAAGLYVNRENVDSKMSSTGLFDEALNMLKPYKNITLC